MSLKNIKIIHKKFSYPSRIQTYNEDDMETEFGKNLTMSAKQILGMSLMHEF